MFTYKYITHIHITPPNKVVDIGWGQLAELRGTKTCLSLFVSKDQGLMINTL